MFDLEGRPEVSHLQDLEPSDILKFREQLKELTSSHQDPAEKEQLFKELVSGMQSVLDRECLEHGGEPVDQPLLWERLPNHESFLVRNEAPEKVWTLLHRGQLLIGGGDNLSKFNHANSIEWRPDHGIERLQPVYEGRGNFHGLFTIIGIKPPAELAISTIKLSDDREIEAIRAMKTYDESSFRHIEGVVKKQDLRFMLMRVPAKYFPTELMTEEELTKFKKSEIDWAKFRLAEAAVMEAKKKRQPLNRPYPKRPAPTFIYRAYLFPEVDQNKAA